MPKLVSAAAAALIIILSSTASPSQAAPGKCWTSVECKDYPKFCYDPKVHHSVMCGYQKICMSKKQCL